MKRNSSRFALLVTLLGQWLRRDLIVVDVQGRSMEPALRQGDRLFCSTRRAIWKGAIVLRAPSLGAARVPVVKRVVALAGEVRNGTPIPPGYCWIEGDSEAGSTDSRSFGPVPVRELAGVAVARLGSDGLLDLRSLER